MRRRGLRVAAADGGGGQDPVRLDVARVAVDDGRELLHRLRQPVQLAEQLTVEVPEIDVLGAPFHGQAEFVRRFVRPALGVQEFGQANAGSEVARVGRERRLRFGAHPVHVARIDQGVLVCHTGARIVRFQVESGPRVADGRLAVAALALEERQALKAT